MEEQPTEAVASVLIVQSDKTLAESLTADLRSVGYEVCGIAASGEHAIMQVVQRSPDLVLMDITLTGKMDGIEAADQIRSRFDIPVVYLAAHADRPSLERTKATDPFGYLTKPASPQDLHAAVEMALYKHKMEKRLRESEEKYRTLFQDSRDAVYITSRGGAVLDVNRSFMQLFGYTEREIMGLNIGEIYVDADGRESFQEIIERADSVKDYETTFRRKDGTEIYCLETATVRRAQDGTILGYQGIIRDITQRKRDEVALRNSKERLRVRLKYILSPEKEVGEITLLDLIQLEDLQRIQDSFAKATGVASIISDVEGNPITASSNFCGVCESIRGTEVGNRRCVESDRILGEKARKLLTPTYQECLSCGFVDASAPIIVAGQHIANWLIGQSNVMGVDRRRIQEYAVEIGANPAEMLRAYDLMPDMSLDRFTEVLDLLWLLAQEISTLGYNNLNLAKELTERRRAEKALQKTRDELEIRVRNRTAALVKANELLETEIAERKRAEKALQEAHDELERRVEERTEFNEKILATSPVGIATYRADGKCVSKNEAMTLMLGTTRNDLLNQDFRLFESWEKTGLLEAAGEVLAKGGTRRQEVHMVTKSGKEVWFDCRMSQFKSGGEPHLLLMADDISDRKQAEDQVRKLTQALIRAQESERERIARDLHDNLAQGLSSLKMAHEMFVDDLGGLKPEMAKRGTMLSRTIHEAIMAVRDLSYGLRPPGLTSMGLHRIVARYCKDFSVKTGIRVDFQSAGIADAQLDSDTAINLFRVVQEALRNTEKHGKATRITVRLTGSLPSIELRVKDDGKGFDVEERTLSALKEKRMGLLGMKERVSLLKGRMQIQSYPGSGTTIRVEVPWKEATSGS